MSVKKFVHAAVAGVLLGGFASVASAITVTPVPDSGSDPGVDFSTANGGPEGYLAGNASTVTVGGVTATGWARVNDAWVQQPLWVRNVPNDNGLGVCNREEADTCVSGAGDVNEIDNNGWLEVVTLDLPTGYLWESLWLSSLDTNNGGSIPEGFRLFTVDPFSVGATAAFTYIGTDAKEFRLTDLGDLASATRLWFLPDTNNGTDNDFLVWGVNLTSVPEPGSLALLGLGLMGMGLSRRRKA